MTAMRDTRLARLFGAAGLVLCAAFYGSVSGAQERNVLVLDETANTGLARSSDRVAPDDGNRAIISIEGDGNGMVGATWPEFAMRDGFAAPGIVAQTGQGNVARLDVVGNQNLFSILQDGPGNSASGSITGFGNAAAVMQRGAGNIAAFSQIGTGNSLAIAQSSW